MRRGSSGTSLLKSQNYIEAHGYRVSPLIITNNAVNDQVFNSITNVRSIGTQLLVLDPLNARFVIKNTDLTHHGAAVFSSGDGKIDTNCNFLYYSSTTAKIYVSQQNVDYIAVYDVVFQDGEVLSITYSTRFGGPGSGDGEFNTPHGITGDGTHLYVCDRDQSRIQKFSESDYSFVAKIGSSGSENDQFNRPYDICCDGTYLYVIETANARINKRLASDLSYVGKVSTGDATGYRIFCDAGETGNVYITHGLYYLTKYLKDLTLVGSVGSQGSGNLQFDRVKGGCVYDGYLYVGDYYASANDRLHKFLASDMSHVAIVGSHGNAVDVLMADTGYAAPPAGCTTSWVVDEGTATVADSAALPRATEIKISPYPNVVQMPFNATEQQYANYNIINTNDTVLIGNGTYRYTGVLKDCRTGMPVLHDTSKTYIYYHDGVNGLVVDEFDFSTMAFAGSPQLVLVSGDEYAAYAHLVLQIAPDVFTIFFTRYSAIKYVRCAFCATHNGTFTKSTSFAITVDDADAGAWEESIESNKIWIFDSEDTDYIYGYIGIENMSMALTTDYKVGLAKVKISKTTGEATYIERFENNPLDLCIALDGLNQSETPKTLYYGAGNSPVKIGNRYALYFGRRTATATDCRCMRLLSKSKYFDEDVILQSVRSYTSFAEKFDPVPYNGKLYLFYYWGGPKYMIFDP